MHEGTAAEMDSHGGEEP